MFGACGADPINVDMIRVRACLGFHRRERPAYAGVFAPAEKLPNGVGHAEFVIDRSEFHELMVVVYPHPDGKFPARKSE